MWKHAVHCWHVHFTSASSSLTAGISNRYLGGVCGCVRVHNQRTCSVHTNRHANTVWEWGGWGFRACECTYLHGTFPNTPITAHPGGGGQVTDIHWFGSFHLFVLFIDFHYSSSCRSLPCFRRHFHCVSSHFASRRTQAQLHAYLLASANQSTSSTFFFSPLLILCFVFFMVDLFVVNQFVQ